MNEYKVNENYKKLFLMDKMIVFKKIEGLHKGNESLEALK